MRRVVAPWMAALLTILFSLPAAGHGETVLTVTQSQSPTSPPPQAEEETGGETESHDELLRIHQINIGFGDAYLLTVGDLVVLVDCGTNTTQSIKTVQHYNYPLFEYLEATGIDHVDVHFITHWHNDHCYNVNMIGERWGTEDTVVYGPTTEVFRDFAPLSAGTYRQLQNGDRLTIGPLEVLCVGPQPRKVIPGNRNIDSLNFIVTYGDVTVFFTGDYVRSNILQEWREELTDIDIISFPHHTSEIQENPARAYKVMNPRLVLITSNELGIVRQFALHTAHAPQEAVYLSYRHGHVLVTTDGENIWYATDVKPGETPLGQPLPPRSE